MCGLLLPTGNTRAVARDPAGRFDDPAVERIRPRRERPYHSWLARSFVPGSTVAIDPVGVDIDAALDRFCRLACGD